MDEATIMQTRLIAVETAIEKLNKAISEFQQAHTGLLENRIKILEDARIRQIQLNSTFAIKK